ncbi:MAG: putative iron-sulfur cluster-binding metallochaperone [Longimicrobiales bacterium]
MAECCGRAEHPERAGAGTCPLSGTTAPSVDELTVKALLTETALRRFSPGSYRFCPHAACDVVYFDDAGSVFTTHDVRVGVWQKQPAGTRTFCYCFDENEVDITRDVTEAGRSAAADRVRGHIAAGRCACEVRNPRGVCCLGDVIKAVERIEVARATWVSTSTR